MNTIVVGVDGSAGSVDALRFAIDWARLSNASVKAVAAWNVHPIAGWDESVPDDVESDRVSTEARLAKALEEAQASHSGVLVSSDVVRGQPAEVLCEAAEGADLLVVGSRGLGGFRGLLLGSVSQQCTNHASCPVVIIPPRHAPQDDSD